MYVCSTLDYCKRASILVQVHQSGSAVQEQGPPSHIPDPDTDPLYVAVWHGDRIDVDTSYSSYPSEHL